MHYSLTGSWRLVNTTDSDYMYNLYCDIVILVWPLLQLNLGHFVSQQEVRNLETGIFSLFQ